MNTIVQINVLPSDFFTGTTIEHLSHVTPAVLTQRSRVYGSHRVRRMQMRQNVNNLSCSVKTRVAVHILCAIIKRKSNQASAQIQAMKLQFCAIILCKSNQYCTNQKLFTLVYTMLF